LKCAAACLAVALGVWSIAAPQPAAAEVAHTVGRSALAPRYRSAKKRHAHAATSVQGIVLWADPATGQLFARPGDGRGRVVVSYSVLGKPIEREVEKRVEKKTRATVTKEIEKVREESRVGNAALAKQIQAMQPASRDYADRWLKKLRIGTLLYGDYALYTHTSFGPQFLTEINPPGPGNNLHNSFDITRAYLNFYFTPTADWTFRLTPDIYRTAGAAASATKQGRITAIGSNLDGDLAFRLKYAYLDYNHPFDRSEMLRGGTLTLGQQSNPFIAWENDLWGFRYVARVPWNYLSLSSTQTGLAVHGPITFNALQYFDYDFGVYTNASYRVVEQTNAKQAMIRGSLYPFGARSRFDGLGITGFYDYGYANVTPDSTNLLGPSAGQRNGHIDRVAALVHYTAETWGLVGEYEDGHNAFSSANFFSGSGPFDEFSGTGATPSGGSNPTTCVSPKGVPIASCFAAFDALVKATQNNGASHQRGYTFFGHVQIPTTAFTLFGLFQQVWPNTHVSTSPIDLRRFVVGLEYKWNKNLRFAFDSQNVLYYHDQFSFPAAEANLFGANVVGPLGTAPGPVGTKAAPFPVDIPFAVLRDIHAFFLNVEFNY
jgi:hypothetical protein